MKSLPAAALWIFISMLAFGGLLAMFRYGVGEIIPLVTFYYTDLDNLIKLWWIALPALVLIMIELNELIGD